MSIPKKLVTLTLKHDTKIYYSPKLTFALLQLVVYHPQAPE